MRRLHSIYPDYGFDRHAGYGTRQHLAALDTFGVTPIHRKTFAPIARRLASKLDPR
ncbi:MAG: ribonuclease HII, partial [Burkholderiales bacterium]